MLYRINSDIILDVHLIVCIRPCSRATISLNIIPSTDKVNLNSSEINEIIAKGTMCRTGKYLTWNSSNKKENNERKFMHYLQKPFSQKPLEFLQPGNIIC